MYLALGVRRHGWIVNGRWPSLSLHTWVTAQHLGLMGIGAKSLLFGNAIRRPRFHHVQRRAGVAVCVRSARRLAGSLIPMVGWARLGR